MRRKHVQPVKTAAGAAAEHGSFEVWDAEAWTARTEADFTVDVTHIERDGAAPL